MSDKQQVTPFPLRIDPALRERIVAIAKINGRSANAEISKRLEDSFSPSKERMEYHLDRSLQAVSGAIDIENYKSSLAPLIERLTAADRHEHDLAEKLDFANQQIALMSSVLSSFAPPPPTLDQNELQYARLNIELDYVKKTEFKKLCIEAGSLVSTAALAIQIDGERLSEALEKPQDQLQIIEVATFLLEKLKYFYKKDGVRKDFFTVYGVVFAAYAILPNAGEGVVEVSFYVRPKIAGSRNAIFIE